MVSRPVPVTFVAPLQKMMRYAPVTTTEQFYLRDRVQVEKLASYPSKTEVNGNVSE